MRTLALGRGLRLLLAVATSLLNFSCGLPEDRQNEEAEVEEIEYHFSPQGIADLKAKFQLSEKTGWYKHEHWEESPPQYSTLFASVNQNGYYILSSNYVGSEPLEHTRISVRIGKKMFHSKAVSPSSAEHSVQWLADRVVETNRYTEYRDGVILENIADSGELGITIRFAGGNRSEEVELKDADREALIECFQLSILNRMASP